MGEDDDSALVGRGDVGSVWWKAVLRRTMLGTSKEVGREEKPRGRKTAPKWGGGGGKEVLAGGKGAVVSGSLGTLRPLTVSRLALAAATSMIVWAMSVPTNLVVVETRFMIAPFGIMVWKEYEERVVGLLKGRAEGYGVGNLEECLIDWGEKSPEVCLLSSLLGDSDLPTVSTDVFPSNRAPNRPPITSPTPLPLPPPLLPNPPLRKSIPRAQNPCPPNPSPPLPHLPLPSRSRRSSKINRDFFGDAACYYWGGDFG